MTPELFGGMSCPIGVESRAIQNTVPVRAHKFREAFGGQLCIGRLFWSRSGLVRDGRGAFWSPAEFEYRTKIASNTANFEHAPPGDHADEDAQEDEQPSARG